MEIQEIQQRLSEFPAKVKYSSFVEMWLRGAEAKGVTRGPFIDALIAGTTPQAHYGEIAYDRRSWKDEDGPVWVVHSCGRYSRGYECLAEASGVSVSTAKRRIKELSSKNLVRVEQRGKGDTALIVLLVNDGGDYDTWLSYQI